MINLPSGLDISNLIDDLRLFSCEASQTLIYYSKLIKSKDYKSKNIELNNYDDPVTEADLKVNELIIHRIKHKYKNANWGFLTEENVKIGLKDNINSNWLWILDPLDGTKDFIQGTGNYAMHLALSHNNKPLIGVVLIPEKNELWISNGCASWCEDLNGNVKNFNSSSKKNFEEMILVTSKNHSNNYLQELIANIPVKNHLVMGSIGCKVASILRGESDIYISLSLPNKTSPKDWDFAAPEAVLKTAGGSITNLQNKELIYNQANFQHPGIIIATNSYLNHSSICNSIRNIIKAKDLLPFEF